MSHEVSELPYGIGEVQVTSRPSKAGDKSVQCFVVGCQNRLRVPTRTFPGDVCPDHGIRCHYSSNQPTYSYLQPRRNIIASADLFTQRIVRHPFKFESHRLGSERSEDALSWNVFRSLQEARLLSKVAEMLTGIASDHEPTLYLWGICVSDDSCDPWHLLIAARERFESSLPVERPLTEPDIALHLPGKYLILIEAKFTSSNTHYEDGPRQSSSSLTKQELVSIYQDAALRIVNVQAAETASRVYYQLWRNTVFAEWMAKLDHPQTEAFHVNLVRDGADVESAFEFRRMINEPYQNRFQRLTWEKLYSLCSHETELSRLKRYFESKTAGLQRAFAI